MARVAGLWVDGRVRIALLAVFLVACGGAPSLVPSRPAALVSRCGALGLGLYENQQDFDAVEQRVIDAFAPVYGSGDVLCSALDGVTIAVVDGDTEIEPGVFGAYNHGSRVMRLPNRRLSQTVIGHESGHVFQWALRNQGGHDGWDTNGVDAAIERLRVSFWGR